MSGSRSVLADIPGLKRVGFRIASYGVNTEFPSSLAAYRYELGIQAP